jgi:predicted lipid-binding transport protein (Tim44 family)
MRRFLSCLIIFLFTFGLMLTEAEAKRFGGGKSFGVQRSVNNSSFSRPQNLNASPASAANKWLAPLTGLALGGILASLFMGHGLGAGLLSWLLIGGVLLLIVNFIRQRMNPSQPSAAQIKPQPLRDTSAYFRNNAQTYSAQASTPPSGFHAT